MAIRFEGEDEELKSITCYCEGFCPSGEEYGTCTTKPGGKCFTSVELDNDPENNYYTTVTSYGCLPPNGMVYFQCRGKPLVDNKIIKCCDQSDLCNKHLLPELNNEHNQNEPYWNNMTFKVLGTALSVSLAVLVFVFLGFYIKYKRKIRSNNEANTDEGEKETKTTETMMELSNIDIAMKVLENIDEANTKSNGTSISSNGLVQRTVSQQIHMDIMIGSGSYGEIWRGNWRGENVAVKIYSQKGESRWLWETQTFQTVLMRDNNILGYIASDIIGSGDATKMYIITEYHQLGSLRNYLKQRPINVRELVRLAQSLSSGLSHLHLEVFGCKGKPAIAHNNINTKNILVKNDKECCIGDFSRAVRFTLNQNQLNMPTDPFNSETRYLSPEILDDSFDMRNFECFKMSDVYSFALVMWEMLNRCEVQDLITNTTYRLPYEPEIPEGTKEWNDVLKVVKEKRPDINAVWFDDAVLKVVARLLTECWNMNPAARHTILRIKKTLLKLSTDEQ